MENIRYTIVYFLILTFTGLLLTQCKSVEFTVLGFFKKKYSNEIEKPNSVVSNPINSNLPIKASLRIFGVVNDTINNPIKGADMYVFKSDQLVSYTNSDTNGIYSITNFIQPVPSDIMQQTEIATRSKSAETDAIKKEEIDSIRPNEFKILVSANGYKSDEKNIVINPNDSIQLKFVLKKLCSVSGIVVRNDKTPVSEVLILLKNNNGKLSVGRTNPNGEFVIDQLEDGVYTISVSHNKYSFAKQTVELLNGADNKGIIITASAGEISGFIKTTESKKIIQKAIITVQKMNIKDYTVRQPFQIKDTLENKESYKIEGLSAGQYKIQVYAPGYGSVIEETELRENSMQKKQDFALSTEGVISGKLINYNPKDQVVFIVIDDDKNSYVLGNLEIIDNGKYVIRGIASGNYTIVLKWRGLLISKQSIDIKGGKETSDIDFILKEAVGFISGRIVSKSNNEPIENAMIIASSESSGNYAISDKNGNYKISGLPPGTYEIFVNALNYETDSKSKLLLENDKVLENIDFNLTLKKNK